MCRPPNTIAVPFPTVYLVPTPFFQPDEDGDVDETFTYNYDAMVRGDLPELTHFYLTFPPHNLCFANQDRLDLSTLRPYLSDPLPAGDARPFTDYLRGGMLFDVTVEPSSYHVDPPRVTFMGTHQGATAVPARGPQGLADGLRGGLDGRRATHPTMAGSRAVRTDVRTSAHPQHQLLPVGREHDDED